MEMDFDDRGFNPSLFRPSRETERQSLRVKMTAHQPPTPSTLRAFYKKITTFIESATIASPFTLGDSTKRSTALHQSSYPEICDVMCAYHSFQNQVVGMSLVMCGSCEC
jgi:hypothetical protein